jgi:hypothetical protein
MLRGLAKVSEMLRGLAKVSEMLRDPVADHREGPHPNPS